MRGVICMKQKSRKWKQARFNYPEENEIIPGWLAKQSNRNLSFRLLIKWFVRTYGFVDVEDVVALMSGEKEAYEQRDSAPIAETSPTLKAYAPPSERPKLDDDTLHDIEDILNL